MRKLMWFALGFGAACAFCAYGRLPVLLFLPALVLLIAFFAGESRTRQIILVVLGMICGLFWFSRFEKQTIRPVYELDGLTQDALIRCTGLLEETDYGHRVEGSLLIGEKNYTVQCYLDYGEDVAPGKVMSGPFRFRVTAPGGLKESTYYQGEGIFLLAYQRDELTVSDGEVSRLDQAAMLRRKILETLEEALPPDTATFAKALLLGDTSDLDYETKTDFTVSG